MDFNGYSDAVCVLATVSDRGAFEKFNYVYFIFEPLYHCSFYWSTGIVVGMGFPTFVADHGCVSSLPLPQHDDTHGS